MRGPYTRRQFLSNATKLGAATALVGALPFPAFVSRQLCAATTGFSLDRLTLDAALARMIPADPTSNWSAASVGAGDYIERLLHGFDLSPATGDVYGGGPYRCEFPRFLALSAAKKKGWQQEIDRLRKLYSDGLATLDERAGGSFASVPEVVQDAILESLDLEGSAFFAALYIHTMEGVYSHPVYGGNQNFTAWQTASYQGDVHGVRFPSGTQEQSPDAAPWDRFGGYAPDEMIAPGPGPGPDTTTGVC